MKKNIVICVLLALLSTPMFAGHVNETTAKQVAENFLKAKTGIQVKVALLDFEERSAYTNFYVYGNDHCFVIVSASDCVNPILGYSTENGFGTRHMPENVRDLMRSYQEGISKAVATTDGASLEIKARWSDLLEGKGWEVKGRSSVAPLVQTKWDQDYPYNLFCPGGYVTGCVATAMAQVMKYWNYPSWGLGTHKYTDPWNGELSACFGCTVYQWDDMLNEYDETSTEEEKIAVATLMYHVGVSLNTQYGGTSGAFSSDVASALTDRFNYNAQYIRRYYYSDEEWKNTLKEELDNSRPIVYGGATVYTENGYMYFGHEFVCDGYDENDYFHINWGWSGDSDGYYDVLDESGLYMSNADAIIGISPVQCDAAIPCNLSCTLQTDQDGMDYVVLDWDDAEDAQSYNIYKNNMLIGNASGSDYVDDKLSNGVAEISYYVRSVDSNGHLSLGTQCVSLALSNECDELPLAFYFDEEEFPDCLSIGEGEYQYPYGGLGNGLHASYLVLPGLDLSDVNTGIEIDFMRMYLTQEARIQIQYSQDGTNFVDLYSNKCCCPSWNWEVQTIFIPEVASMPMVYIRMEFIGYIVIDNLIIKEAPDCFPPSNFVYENIGYDHATLSWSASCYSSEYVIAYGLKGAPLEDMTLLYSNLNSCTINELSELVEYDLLVKAVCLGEDTDWSEICSFTTCCAPAMPVFYSFDESGPACVVMDEGFSIFEDINNWETGNIVVSQNPGRIVLQPLDMQNVTNGVELNFRWFCDKNRLEVPAQSQPQAIVQYSVDGENWIETGTVVYAYNYVCLGEETGEGWFSYRVNIPKVSDEDVAYVSFYFPYGCYELFGHIGQELEVKPSPWFSPTNVALNAVSTNEAVVSWKQIGQPTQWVVSYGPKGCLEEDRLQILVDNSQATLPDLDPDQEYEVFVKAFYGENGSDWSLPMSFKTFCYSAIDYLITFDEGAVPGCFGLQNASSININEDVFYGASGGSLGFGYNEYNNRSRFIIPLDLSNREQDLVVEFMMYRYEMGFYDESRIQVQYSFDGYEWIDVGDPYYGQYSYGFNGHSYWEKKTTVLPDLGDASFVFIGLLNTYIYGSNFIDNLVIKEANYIEEATSLAAGWTWYVPSVMTSIEALQTALDGNLLIQAEDGTPSGDIVPGRMYKIQTISPCSFAVTGLPITSATILIHHDKNWFGFIGDASAGIEDVFDAGFGPVAGDKVVSQNEGFAIYNGEHWVGTLTMLVPGKGYVYVSQASETKTLYLGQ